MAQGEPVKDSLEMSAGSKEERTHRAGIKSLGFAPQTWVEDANTCVRLRFVHARTDELERNPDADTTGASAAFNPLYSYPVFGESEKIAGHRNLRVRLQYASGSLATFLGVESDATAPTHTGVEPDRVEDMVAEVIKHPYTTDYGAFLAAADRDAARFVPPGAKVAEFSAGGDTFEVFEGSFEDPRLVEYHRRLQTFLVWFIEGASYLEEDDVRWRVFMLFQRVPGEAPGQASYRVAGFCTAYPFYLIPDALRVRISQFLIFPPFQRRGLGRRLYHALYSLFAADPAVTEITVEGPNADFQRVRDASDFDFLRRSGALSGVELPFSRASVVPIGRKHKLCARQIERLCELELLDRLRGRFESDAALHRAFRLQVKRRLYRADEDALSGMELGKRVSTLEELYSDELREYERVLRGLGHVSG